jgi:hypothetical protein
MTAETEALEGKPVPVISLNSITWLAVITQAECLLRGTDWMFNYN